MICNVCGYESSEAFSVCPCCGNKNNRSINTPSINISAQLIEDEEPKNEYIYTGDEIQLENIKLPFGCNKNLIEKKSDNFTLNSVSGGEFFPNREMTKILLSNIGFAAIGFIALPFEWVFFYLIFLAILGYMWVMSTNIKTQFTFSSKGLNIYSKKGSLFIQKENIKNIHIEFADRTYRNSTNRYYTIFVTFNEDVYFPYTKESKKKVTLLQYYSFADDEGKICTQYIKQEIKKVLGI